MLRLLLRAAMRSRQPPFQWEIVSSTPKPLPMTLATTSGNPHNLPQQPCWTFCKVRLLHTTSICAKKRSGKGKKPDKPAKVEESFSDDSDSDEDDADLKRQRQQMRNLNSPAAKFISTGGKTGGSGKKDKGKHKTFAATYDEVSHLTDIDEYWQSLEDILEEQRKHFVTHLTLRSANAIDELEVEFEGESFKLREVADISKKDPKKIIIDSSSIPQATVAIMKTLQGSGNMNLNPQQEGTRIYVPIPKVTKETREKLAKAAHSQLNETKEKLRKAYSKECSEIGNLQLKGDINVSDDETKASYEVLKAMSDHFFAMAKDMAEQKQKDLLNK